ncbi:MAG: NAD(P)-dependent oxidoreductase, partial [bacterium]
NIERADQLGLILIAATGTDNVDLEACKERGIVVCNARQYSNPAVVQHTFTLMLCLMTNILRYQRDVVSGRWDQSDIFCLLDYPIREMSGKSLGIVGYGNLGKAVAKIARGFDMQINICQRPNSEPQAGRLPLNELLAESDVVSLHCPLTPDTYHLFNRETLSLMKPDSILINTARGAIVEPESLVSALKAGNLGGAGIDVLDSEPPSKNHPLLAKDIANLLVTPHNAWGTRESRQRLLDQMATNLRSWRDGSPQNVVT